jgi:hypothetical protein
MESEKNKNQIDTFTLGLHNIFFLVLNISIEVAKLSFSSNLSKGGI